MPVSFNWRGKNKPAWLGPWGNGEFLQASLQNAQTVTEREGGNWGEQPRGRGMAEKLEPGEMWKLPRDFLRIWIWCKWNKTNRSVFYSLQQFYCKRTRSCESAHLSSKKIVNEESLCKMPGGMAGWQCRSPSMEMLLQNRRRSRDSLLGWVLAAGPTGSWWQKLIPVKRPLTAWGYTDSAGRSSSLSS